MNEAEILALCNNMTQLTELFLVHVFPYIIFYFSLNICLQ